VYKMIEVLVISCAFLILKIDVKYICFVGSDLYLTDISIPCTETRLARGPLRTSINVMNGSWKNIVSMLLS